MNVDLRCRQPIARATAGRGTILPSHTSPILFTAQSEPAPPTPQFQLPAVPGMRINLAIAVCLASSLFILLAGPEFIPI